MGWSKRLCRRTSAKYAGVFINGMNVSFLCADYLLAKCPKIPVQKISSSTLGQRCSSWTKKHISFLEDLNATGRDEDCDLCGSAVDSQRSSK